MVKDIILVIVDFRTKGLKPNFVTGLIDAEAKGAFVFFILPPLERMEAQLRPNGGRHLKGSQFIYL